MRLARWFQSNRELGLLAALALAVYLSALWWGLPVATSEPVIRGWDIDAIGGISVLAEFHNLLIQAKPDWFVAYPLFHYLLLGICYAPYLAWLLLTGGLSAPGAVFPYGFEDPVAAIANLALIGRLLATFMAVGTVLAAYQAARIIWDRHTGLVTGLIVMLSGPMVYRARTGNLDVPVLFWTALGVLVLAAVAKSGLSIRRAVLLGACAALATATKDQAYGGWLAVVALVTILHWRGAFPAADAGTSGIWKAPLAMIGSGIAVYAVANGIVVSPHRFVAHVQFILGYEEARFAFAELALERAKTFHGFALLARDVARTLSAAVGIPVVLMALAGIISGRGASRFYWLLGAMLAGYLVLVVAPIAHMQYRYALLPAFLLAFPAAHWLVAWLRGPATRRYLAGVAGVVSLVWLVANAGNLTYQMLFDARYDAGDWLAANLAPGQRIGFFGDKGQLPAIPIAVVVERLPGGPSSTETLRGSTLDAVLVIPDYTAPADGERSLFLPKSTYQALRDGSLPYDLAARFETLAPWGVRYPFVNPPVRIFVRQQ